MDNSLSIAENERRYVAQELHDHVAQTLLQMNMQVSICQQYLHMGATDALKAELALLEQQTHTASKQLREMISDLLPPFSKDGSFKTWLIKHISTHRKRGGAPISFSISGSVTALSSTQQLAVARIIQEALQNIRKHAQADKIDLSIQAGETRFQLTITDDGIGFDDALIPNPLTERGGAGVVNMFIRAEAIGATLDIKSKPGKGTFIQLTVPL